MGDGPERGERGERGERTDTARVRGGWAGDLVAAGGAAWVAWADFRTREGAFVGEGDREWRLLPGAIRDRWRTALRDTSFSVALARLEGAAPAGAREVERAPRTIEGPALAALPGAAEPAVLWVRAPRPRAGSALLASILGEPRSCASSRGAILGPRAAADASGRLWVAWQQWPERPSDPAAGPHVAVAVRERPGTWSAPWPLSSAGAAWAPALAADAQGGLWCAWDSWDGGRYRISVSHKAEQGDWSAPLEVSATDRPWLDLAPDVAAGRRAGVGGVEPLRPAGGASTTASTTCARCTRCEVTLGAGGSLAARAGAGRVHGRGRAPAGARAAVPALDRVRVREPPGAPGAPRGAGAGGLLPLLPQRRVQGLRLGDPRRGPRRGRPGRRRSASRARRGFPDTPYGVVRAPDSGGGDAWLLAYHAGDYALRPDDHPSKPVAGPPADGGDELP